MKVLILAAGKGVRMRPLTLNKPKPLIEVNGRPFLSYMVDRLINIGLDNIAVVVNYKKEVIFDFFKKRGIDATFIEQHETLGTGHAVMQAKDWAGNDDFVVINGDCIYAKDDMKRLAIPDGHNYIGVIRHSEPERYGVVIERNSMLEHIIEKPKEHISDLVNTGLYKFTRSIFDALHNIGLSERGEYELTDAVSILAKEHGVKVIKLRYWLELGKPDDISYIESFLRKGND